MNMPVVIGDGALVLGGLEMVELGGKVATLHDRWDGCAMVDAIACSFLFSLIISIRLHITCKCFFLPSLKLSIVGKQSSLITL